MLNLAPKHLDIVTRILNQYLPAADVWAFGSRVTGTTKKFSDLDLAIIADKPLTLNQLGELREAFSESDLPIKVDVIDFRTATPEFQRIIKSNYLILSP